MHYDESKGEFPTKMFEFIRDGDFLNLVNCVKENPNGVLDTNYLNKTPVKLAIELNDPHSIRIMVNNGANITKDDIDWVRAYSRPEVYGTLLELLKSKQEEAKERVEVQEQVVPSSTPLPKLKEATATEHSPKHSVEGCWH